MNIADSADYFNAVDRAFDYDFCQLSLLDSRSKFDRYSGKCQGQRDRTTEAFECRCAYYIKSDSPKCKKGECARYTDKSWYGDNIELMYYQLPVSDGYNGKVDILLRDTEQNIVYLVEYKPERDKSAERLLRMVCEIATYYETVVKDGNAVDFLNKKFKTRFTTDDVKKAIMFNENSPQHAEYIDAIEHKRKIVDLMDKQQISVFVLKNKSRIEKIG